ncbi:PP2C family protein-serine/threonine phosphatase [Mycobacterium sp. 1274761.0]|uniref:PP2C family protein-serine/threonine phosphatase n=1 Tax=Mycobacterium sp. 1274761.0 TaxID=1834077 RepID=UPI0008023641|nr:GAF domain-containing SpoIIE family protein phosphatase [Mycobacterium sp. 1274761.0]OBK71970.1 serine/threonine protein phosphatase [Mycobacterium sp. 1274761.0]
MTSDVVSEGFVLSPELEDARMRSVEQLQLLGSPPEERFARITRMARQIFGVPMAAVSLVDRDHQWFKQNDGLDLAGAIPRQETVCRATIARTYEGVDEPALIIEDAREAPDFCELPAIKADGGVRFYAGYPLFGPGGHAVGTFCIYDTEPRALDSEQLETFRELAGWVQRELEQTDEMERAAEVQRHLLPRALGDLPGYSVCAMCIPAFAVGGDFYDHYPSQRGVIFTVADVMGKGLGAAILTASVRSAMRAATKALDETAQGADLADAVNSVAAQLSDDLTRTDTFVTMFHARLETATGSVQYVDAGHGFAVIVRKGGEVEPLSSEGTPLGVLPDDFWTSKEVHLDYGETLVIASDGVLDLSGDGSDVRPALAFVAEHADPADLCSQTKALAAVNVPMDDITLLAIRRELTG